MFRMHEHSGNREYGFDKDRRSNGKPTLKQAADEILTMCRRKDRSTTRNHDAWVKERFQTMGEGVRIRRDGSLHVATIFRNEDPTRTDEAVSTGEGTGIKTSVKLSAGAWPT